MEVKALRKAAGMTQQQFSDYFEISKRTIEDWERQRNKCSKYLLALMQYKLEKEGLLQYNSPFSAG